MHDVSREKRADKSEALLRSLSISETKPVDEISYYQTPQFKRPNELPLDEFDSCDVGFAWQRERTYTPNDRVASVADLNDTERLPDDLSLGTSVWFRLRFTIPESMSGYPVFLRFEAKAEESKAKSSFESEGRELRAEALCYRDGVPWQAFDGGHEKLLLTENAAGGEQYDLLIEVGTTALWGEIDLEEFWLHTAEIYATRKRVAELHRNVHLLNDLRKEISTESPNYGKILRGLQTASETFAFQAEDEATIQKSANEALTVLDEMKSGLTSDLTDYRLTVVGHAHVDLAWLWPWSETVRKGGRTFATAQTLIEEYPEFTFVQSQPHLYEFVKSRYPELYEELPEKIDDGQWLPTGGMWVEADVNISGGEALARQYLLGKRYFRDQYDVDPKITFIPDVFGYSPALPGISKAAGCPYFLTQKMSWNEINEFPYKSFVWEGIDGSSLLAHLPPTDTYNGMVEVNEVRKAITNYPENDILDESTYLIGWGDGGGGTTREMIEKGRVINEINSLPDFEFGTLIGFFERLSEHVDELPQWTGELYLEKHRGTLTSQAQTKRNNRKAEFALREAEIWSSAALALAEDFSYDADRLDTAWKILLFNQFHDILPGSSITEVYRDADRDYEELFEIASGELSRSLSSIFESRTPSNLLSVTNSLSWERDQLVEASISDLSVSSTSELCAKDGASSHQPVQRLNDETVLFKAHNLPSIGVKTFELSEATENGEGETQNPLSVSTETLENERIRVEFSPDGTISAYDKDADRQVFDDAGNRFMLYRDLPREFDAWDIEGDLYRVGEQLPAPTTEVVECGPLRATVSQTREFGDSQLIQEISLRADSKRIDFETYVDWHESEKMLKVEFPVAVSTSTATYETQFGHHERPTHSNTTWDEARFEEAHQKWVDVAEHGFGLAVLNDCKYASNVDGTDIGLSLLRAPKNPDPEADQGEHQFQYSLLPHVNNFREAGVIKQAYEINTPVQTLSIDSATESSLLDVSSEGIVVEAIKQAEDDDSALVIRLYEAWGRHTTTTISPQFSVESAVEMNLIEDVTDDLEVEGTTLSLEFTPFEIKTVQVKLS